MTMIIRSERYEKNIEELDGLIIIMMAIRIKNKYPGLDLNKWENMKWAMDNYHAITKKSPGHIGAVAEALQRWLAKPGELEQMEKNLEIVKKY